MPTKFKLPKLEAMDPLEPGANIMHHDLYNMGCMLSGHWMALYDQHVYHQQDQRPQKDPGYIIFYHVKTGQRFRLVFDPTEVAKGNFMQEVLKERELTENCSQCGGIRWIDDRESPVCKHCVAANRTNEMQGDREADQRMEAQDVEAEYRASRGEAE